MCWQTNASRPRVKVRVAFRWPPQASTLGPSSPRSMASGTKPRARRRKAGAPSTICITLSSARTTMSRSWVTTRSAMSGKFAQRFGVVGDERLAAGVGGGRDQREIAGASATRAGDVKQQVMDGRIGEHHAEPRHVGATVSGKLRRESISTIGCAGVRSSAVRRASTCHNSDRRLRSRASARTVWPRGSCARRSVATVSALRASHMKMEAADAFQRHDFSRAQGGDDFARRMRQARPAFFAGDGLGVEAAIGRVGIVLCAIRAHRKAAIAVCARS